MRERFTIEYIKEFVECSGKYTLLSDFYKNASTELEVKCNTCNDTFKTSYRKLYNGHWCAKCSIKKNANKKRLTHDYVKMYIEKDNKYELLNEYKTSKDYLNVKCNTCDHIWNIKWNNFQQGYGCPKCAINNSGSSSRLTIDYIKEKMREDGYTLLSEEYKNSHQRLKIKCDTCDNIWEMNWNNFKIGKRCPKCYELTNSSKGVRKIKSILEDYNIEFITEYRFDDCKYKYTLPFDFYLPNYNLLIEYDGQHHFKPQDFAGKGEEWAKEQFENTQIRDSIKNEYCRNNNIHLIRIPYTELNNIKEILLKELKL